MSKRDAAGMSNGDAPNCSYARSSVCMSKRDAPNCISLRSAKESDLAWLNSYCAQEGMDNLDDIDFVTVAVNTTDEPVGFIQVAYGPKNIAHVYPIVVHKSWRGYGVGRELIENANKKHGELRLVSRGSSVGFYERLGFEACAWDLIDNELTEGCIDCPSKDTCAPLPMRLF